MRTAYKIYDPTSQSGTIIKQKHYAEVLVSSNTASVRIVAVDTDELIQATKLYTLANGQSRIEVEHEGGTWEGIITRVLILTGTAIVKDIGKDLLVCNDKTEGAATTSTMTAARHIVGQDITVDDLELALDETVGGDYGGTGVLIERPDWVIKHFLVEHMGIPAGDIDASSFASAGALYAAAISGGYKFGFLIPDGSRPSDLRKRLAQEARSVLWDFKGKWHLYYLPDSAPVAVKTISEDELAGTGSMSEFDNKARREVKTQIQGYYKRNYWKGEHDDGDWLGRKTLDDAAAQAKYGGILPKKIELMAVTSDAMAEDVLTHMFLQVKSPLKRVEFPVLWDNHDLQVGDTIQLDSGIFTGKKFFIENVRFQGDGTAIVAAIEWWE